MFTHQKVVAPPHRFRTTSTSSVDGQTRRKRTTSTSSTGSTSNMASNKAGQKQQPKPAAPPSASAGDGKKQVTLGTVWTSQIDAFICHFSGDAKKIIWKTLHCRKRFRQERCMLYILFGNTILLTAFLKIHEYSDIFCCSRVHHHYH